MDEQLQKMFDVACRIGEEHSLRFTRQADELRILRGAIWRAAVLLRGGRAEQALRTLEKALKSISRLKL